MLHLIISGYIEEDPGVRSRLEQGIGFVSRALLSLFRCAIASIV